MLHLAIRVLFDECFTGARALSATGITLLDSLDDDDSILLQRLSWPLSWSALLPLGPMVATYRSNLVFDKCHLLFYTLLTAWLTVRAAWLRSLSVNRTLQVSFGSDTYRRKRTSSRMDRFDQPPNQRQDSYHRNRYETNDGFFAPALTCRMHHECLQ